MNNSLCILAVVVLATPYAWSDEFGREIRPLLNKYCADCHSGDDPKGQIDFTAMRTSRDIDDGFEIWEQSAQRLLERDMPPGGELQPTEIERSRILDWYQKRFVDQVEARPALFRPRRLSATEYRNTLRSLFGFDLEVAIVEAEQTQVEKSLVMKLLPEDPPGRSGFRNDTHGNPLTTVIWDQYSYLVDHALEEFFDPANRQFLESYVGPIDRTLTAAQAETLLRKFIPRVRRRPLPESELFEILGRARVSQTDARIEWVKTELKSALMSPTFIHRGLLMPRPIGQHPVDDFELAERLSYFLWGDMPDEQLTQLAAGGELAADEVLRAQVDRMIASPKGRHLAEDFAFQWLNLAEIDHTTDNFPLRQSLAAQPVEFMHFLFTGDRPLMELIDSDVTFANPLIAKFYPNDRKQLATYRKPQGIEVEFVPHQQIRLEHTVERGGVLTMPGVLAMNRGPVQRGTWMLERILGEHLPDPPADVGVVASNRKGENLTFRERFELHRTNPTCAICHDKIDPLGFALQRYRDDGTFAAGDDAAASDKGKRKPSEYHPGQSIDTSGQLPSGETFEDMQGLKRLLMTSRRPEIIRNIVEKTLAYALCRNLEIHDKPVVDRIVADLDRDGGTYRDLLHHVVTSPPFRQTVIPPAQTH